MTSTVRAVTSAAAIELRLTVVWGREESEDLILVLPRETTVRELTETVVSRRGLGDASGRLGFGLRCERLGTLPALAHILESGLRDGDRVELRPRRGAGDDLTVVGAAGAVALFDLVVTAGPAAGRRFALGEGVHTLGRDEECEIALPDRSVSRRHLQIAIGGGEPRIRDLDSRNGTAIDGMPLAAGVEHRVEPGSEVEAGRTLFSLVEPGQPIPSGGTPLPDGRVPHNRPPRLPRPATASSIDLGPVPKLSKGFRPPLGASLVPLLIGGVAAVLMNQPVFLLFAAMGPVMAGWTMIADRRSGRAAFKRDRIAFTDRIADARNQAEAARADEIAERRAASPDPVDLLERAVTRRRDLWERSPADPDFLTVRVGVADQPARLGFKLGGGGAEDLRSPAEQLVDEYATVPAVPAVLSLSETGVLGLCGPSPAVAGLARWLIVQAGTLHSPRELAIAAAIAPAEVRDWDWLKWLPHTRPGDPILADSQLGASTPSARAILRAIIDLVSDRQADLDSRFGLKRSDIGPAVLVVIDESLQIERSQVVPLLAQGPAVGVYTLWLGREEDDLPGQCGAMAILNDDIAELALIEAASGEQLRDVTADQIDVGVADTVARALAPVQDSSAAGGRSELPRRASLPDLLGLDPVAGDVVATRWQAPAARRGLRLTLGVAVDGPFDVDLRVDGPHALVAGTTGAGKSELLQTLVASLAASYPPHRVSFLLVDYKGGAAFKDCVELPHVVGMVTDLDSHLTHRALISLNAELRRRERLLARGDAHDLSEMERIAPDDAPANLIVIVDEFAALAREVPAFVDGLVDVAQRGRSLGVHLVLATQRPGGVVSENIRANTNLRIALRVATPEQSTDVIAVADAARIPRSMPGRAFARTGAADLTEFQSAYVGAPAAIDGHAAGIEIGQFLFDPTAVARRSRGATTMIERRVTDLGAIVAGARIAADLTSSAIPPSPWLPALPSTVALEELDGDVSIESSAGSGIVGLVDEPSAQRQWTLTLDLATDGSVLIYGASGAGKTTLLRTLAASLALRSNPDELRLYGLDFASGGLGGLEALPHCGSIIAGDDDERVRRVLRMLRTEIDRRKRLLGAAGALTLEEFTSRSGAETLPRLVLLLDSYAGFTSAYDRVDAGLWTELVPRIVADGRTVGIHMIATGDRRAAVPPPVAGLVPRKLVLRMADDDDYQSLGLDSRSVRAAVLPPGRGFAPGGLEFQAALLGGDASAEAQAQALARLGAELATAYPGDGAPRILVLPTSVSHAELPVSGKPLTATFALGDDRLAPLAADLSDSHFVIAGPYRSGRTTAVAAIVAGLLASTPDLEAHLLSPRRSDLPACFAWTSVAVGEEECVAAARRLADGVATRDIDADFSPMLVVVDDGGEIGDGPAAGPLETIVRRGRDVGVRVVLGIEAGAARVAFTPWIKELRKDGHGLLLDPDQDLHGDILSVRLPRRTGGALPPGRGYYVRSGAVELVQTAIANG